MRGRRFRPLDGVLVAVAVVMVIATTGEVRDFFGLRERSLQDVRTVAAYVARADPGQQFETAEVVRPLQGMDIACAAHRGGRGADYRLCLLLRRTGPVPGRAVGSYRRPPAGFDEEAVHSACFGAAIGLHLCPRRRPTAVTPP